MHLCKGLRQAAHKQRTVLAVLPDRAHDHPLARNGFNHVAIADVETDMGPMCPHPGRLLEAHRLPYDNARAQEATVTGDQNKVTWPPI